MQVDLSVVYLLDLFDGRGKRGSVVQCVERIQMIGLMLVYVDILFMLGDKKQGEKVFIHSFIHSWDVSKVILQEFNFTYMLLYITTITVYSWPNGQQGRDHPQYSATLCNLETFSNPFCTLQPILLQYQISKSDKNSFQSAIHLGWEANFANKTLSFSNLDIIRLTARIIVTVLGLIDQNLKFLSEISTSFLLSYLKFIKQKMNFFIDSKNVFVVLNSG